MHAARRAVLFLFLKGLGVSSAFAQTDVRGRVTDADSRTPLAGVIVVAKGTTVGTITDSDGEYELSVPAGVETLTFSFIGFETLDGP